MTIFLMVLPLLCVDGPLKINFSTILPGLFQKSSVSINDVHPSGLMIASDQELSTQSSENAFPLSVLGGNLYYEWSIFNGTGRITWSGSSLEPINMIIRNVDEGLRTTISFSFDSLEWGISATYLGYAVPLAI